MVITNLRICQTSVTGNTSPLISTPFNMHFSFMEMCPSSIPCHNFFTELPKRGKKLQARTLQPEGSHKHGSLFHRNVHIKLITYYIFALISLRDSHSSNGPDVEGEALIELLKSLNDTNHRIKDWDNNLVSPCFSWSGVVCRNGYVVSLSLDSIGFSGTLSSAITKLKHLASLELQNNNLSGMLPDFLGDMLYLQTLNLANNKFSGPIPSSWGHLSNLKHLILSGNHISGTIPDTITNITGLTEVDLSSNNLTGEIPVQLFSVPTYNFTGTSLICGSSFSHPCMSNSPLPASSGKSKIGVTVASASCGAFILLSLGAIFAYTYHQACKSKHDVFVDVAGEDDRKICFAQVRRFSWREVQLATDNFCENNVIGQGGFGKVYKGVLPDKTKVAVKRLTDHNSPGGEAAFLREVELISVAVHRNLLRLIGFCTTSSERILVYPYMKNLSLAYHLRDLKPGEQGLDWPTRKRIAFGAAHGLEYLHEHCNPKIIHRDLKAANILLDDDFEAVLGDFGLAKPVDVKLTQVTTQIRGTMGHIAPEYLSTGKSSEKTDVFGYGITLLELVTGQRAIDFSRLEEDEDVLLLDHIKKLLKEDRLQDRVDRNLSAYDPKEVEKIIQVALLCTQSSPEDRPTMSEVVKMLQGAGLSERWAQWEQHEEERSRQSLFMSHHFPWESSATTLSGTQQEAIQLSKPR